MTIQAVPAYLQNASHSAALFRQAIASGVLTGGICGAGELLIAAQSSPNMTVQVGAGRAIVPGTQVSAPTLLGGGSGAFTTQGNYFLLNDATISVTISTANATNPRIDAVYAGVQDAYYSGSTNTALIGVVTGVPAPSPAAPAIPNNAILLGYVAVAANATSIVNANITIAATLTVPTPSPTIGDSLLKPSSVTGGTVSSFGRVDFSGVSAITVNGVFSTLYTDYEIFIDVTSGAGQLKLTETSGGTPSTIAYYDEILYANVAAVTAAQDLNAASWTLTAAAGAGHKTAVELSYPANAQPTTLLCRSSDFPNLTGASLILTQLGGYHNSAAAYDGFQLTTTSGTITGSLRVVGRNRG
jgi:hypothetical protein